MPPFVTSHQLAYAPMPVHCQGCVLQSSLYTLIHTHTHVHTCTHAHTHIHTYTHRVLHQLHTCSYRISREAGVNIITGTGYYVDALMPEDAKMMSVREVSTSVLSRIMVKYAFLGCYTRKALV